MVPRGCRFRCWCRRRFRPIPPVSAPFRWLERNLLIFLGFGFSSQAEGRRFETGLALHTLITPSATTAGGVFVGQFVRKGRGRNRPSGAVKVREREVDSSSRSEFRRLSSTPAKLGEIGPTIRCAPSAPPRRPQSTALPPRHQQVDQQQNRRRKRRPADRPGFPKHPMGRVQSTHSGHRLAPRAAKPCLQEATSARRHPFHGPPPGRQHPAIEPVHVEIDRRQFRGIDVRLLEEDERGR